MRSCNVLETEFSHDFCNIKIIQEISFILICQSFCCMTRSFKPQKLSLAMKIASAIHSSLISGSQIYMIELKG